MCTPSPPSVGPAPLMRSRHVTPWLEESTLTYGPRVTTLSDPRPQTWKGDHQSDTQQYATPRTSGPAVVRRT
jgi:hypothetical protein